jgi:hypothetical protein
MITKSFFSDDSNASLDKLKLQPHGRSWAMLKLLVMTSLLIFVLFVLAPAPADADLINNGNDLIYDTDLNITWYNPSVGNMTWDQANIWITNLNTLSIGGVTGWRLPTALNYLNGSYPAYGYNVTESEPGHLYYEELGNSADMYDNSTLITGPFANLQSVNYWTSTTDAKWAGTPGKAFAFSFITGSQGTAFMDLAPSYSVLAVHTGNISSASHTPIPGAILLLGPGLVCLAIIRNKFMSH